MEQIDLKQLIEQYPEVLTDGTKLKAYILDLYPQCKRGMVNILVAIQQCGIVLEMQASKNPSALDMSRWKKVLNDDYGFAEAMAETCLQLWCGAFEIQLGAKVNAEQKANATRSKVQNDNCQSKQLSVEVGDVYTFGAYQQDKNTSNSKEPIKWLVLAKEDNKILLISEKALDCQKYNDSCADVTWETCSLRKWLNSTFLNAAFSTAEQKKIVSTTVSTDKYPNCNADSGIVTTDKVFLLSYNETKQYFENSEARKCVPTAYAKANGAKTNNSYTKDGVATCWWWLRSPGGFQNRAARVYYGGATGYWGGSVDDGNGCVRPALWTFLNTEDKEREEKDSQRKEQERKAKEAQEQRERKAREEKERRERELAEAKRREEQKRLEQQRLALEKERREKGVCQHCGGEFKGLFMKKCAVCGRRKDY